MSFHAGVRKELLYQLVIVPLWVSYLVRGYAWKTILGSEGVLNGFLQYIHVTREPVSFFLYSPFAVILMLTHIYTPFVFLPLYASLEHIPRNLIEASQDLGASSTRHVFARHLTAFASRTAGRRDVCLCSDTGGFPRAASSGRPFQRDDRQYRAKPFRNRV